MIKIADNLEKNCDLILNANQIDMENAKSAGISQALLDRLLLTKHRVIDIAKGAIVIAKLNDPLGLILFVRNLANG
ncbi:MAG: gamma-glutamyl-phosphate reductase, partial [Candidatus Nanopelagicus sp.]